MSDLPLDMREQLARIDRSIAEGQKLQEATRKFVVEAHKLAAERDKLAAEARKLNRDRTIAPWQLAVLLMGTIGGFFGGAAGILALLKAIGVI